jgi:hypothetical protein
VTAPSETVLGALLGDAPQRDRRHPAQPDPSPNVIARIETAVARSDALRLAEQMRLDQLRGAEQLRVDGLLSAERRRIDEQLQLRAEYSVQLAVAEAKRIDAIRAVDVAAVAVANERATAQAAVLASQVTTSAETLRSLVAATAETQARQLSQLTDQQNVRLTNLEKSQYESKGSGTGMRDMYGWIFGGLMAAWTIYTVLHKG